MQALFCRGGALVPLEHWAGARHWGWLELMAKMPDRTLREVLAGTREARHLLGVYRELEHHAAAGELAGARGVVVYATEIVPRVLWKQRCKACGARVDYVADDEGARFGHPEPVCEGYAAVDDPQGIVEDDRSALVRGETWVTPSLPPRARLQRVEGWSARPLAELAIDRGRFRFGYEVGFDERGDAEPFQTLWAWWF